jgi:hypothetical protein
VLNFTLMANEPGWVALRVPTSEMKNEMGEVIFGPTSPISLEFNGQSVFRKDAAEALLAEMETALKVIPTKARFDDDARREWC